MPFIKQLSLYLQGYLPDEELQLYAVQQSRRNSQNNWRDAEMGMHESHGRGIYGHLPGRNNSQM